MIDKGEVVKPRAFELGVLAPVRAQSVPTRGYAKIPCVDWAPNV